MKIDDFNLVKHIAAYPDGARHKDMPIATREADAVRQRCRRSGWIVYEERDAGKRWFVTSFGLKMMREYAGDVSDD